MKNVDAVDRRRADNFGAQAHRHGAVCNNGAHRHLGRLSRLRWSEQRIVGVVRHRPIEAAFHRHVQPVAGGAVMAALPQGIEYGVAVEPGHQITGQSTDRAECGGARLGRARPALMVIAVAYDADAVAAVEGIMQKPLEGPPRRVNLDRAFEAAVMGHIDVGVAAADMGDDHSVFVVAAERLEQLVCGMAILRRWIGNQYPRGPADRPSLGAIEDVAVPAHPGIAGPFIAGQGDKTSGLVELARQAVQGFPECIRDLKVVALMPDDVDERLVAGIAEILGGRVRADGLLALRVQVAPIVSVWRACQHTHRC